MAEIPGLDPINQCRFLGFTFRRSQKNRAGTTFAYGRFLQASVNQFESNIKMGYKPVDTISHYKESKLLDGRTPDIGSI